MKLISVNPTNLELLVELDTLSSEEVVRKLELSSKVFHEWSKTSFEERRRLLKKLARSLREDDNISKLITNEVGKTIKASKLELEKAASTLEFIANNGEAMLSDREVKTAHKKSFVSFEPLGTILAVMPWNFPFWQVTRFAAPSLMAGNVVVLKHSSNVQMCAAKLEKVFIEAGFPKGVFQNLAISSSQVEEVINNPIIKAVTLTGSEHAGSEVAMQAGRQIKKTVLELGGSDAFIVSEDADIDKSVELAVNGRLKNNAGQVCDALKRFIIHSSIKEEFIAKLKTRVEALKVGDPNIEDTDIGPLVNEQILSTAEEQVTKAISEGARLITGGKRADLKGCFYLPTILELDSKDNTVFIEEVFAPVWSVIGFDKDEDAIEIANSSMFGLGGTIMTKDIKKGLEMARKIESGNVFINSVVASDPRLPFGGIKKSGYGRELSEFGIREFVNIKTIAVD